MVQADGGSASQRALIPEPGGATGRDRALGLAARVAVGVVLVAAPLALGSVHTRSRLPFLAFVFVAGAASWLRARRARARGEPVAKVPARRLLLALNLLVLLQLVPLPPRVLWTVSPGSYEFYREEPSTVRGGWRPVSTSPDRTLRGLAFLAALSLFYGAVYREFDGRARPRGVAGVIVGVAFLMTLTGFVQRASPRPNYVYGIWNAGRADVVFGPYANRSYYAGHVVMALPLALALALESLGEVRRSGRRRARSWTALGEPAASAAALRASVALFIAAGILSAGSRTGVVACAVSLLVLPLAFGRRALSVAALVLLLAGASLYFADIDWFVKTFTREAFESGRVMIWRDMTAIVKDFPVLGVGWNALGPVFRARYQTVHLWGHWEQAHNEYLEVLLDTGACGAAIAAGLFWLLYRSGFRAAARGTFGVGLLGALAANATTNLADFNLQIPANAATFVAIAGLTMAAGQASRGRERDTLPGSG